MMFVVASKLLNTLGGVQMSKLTAYQKAVINGVDTLNATEVAELQKHFNECMGCYAIKALSKEGTTHNMRSYYAVYFELVVENKRLHWVTPNAKQEAFDALYAVASKGALKARQHA
jgi:hypothetical protein